MKINWGTAIVIAFVSFMTFILFFVFKVQSDSQYDNELVVEDYYQQELKLQNQMEREQNSVNLTEKILIKSTQKGIEITFPSTIDFSKVKGKVSLYRPSNQRLDFEIPISLTNPHLLIPKNDLVGGRWDISLDWNYDGKEYLTKRTIYL